MKQIAITPLSQPVTGEVFIPGSKSYTNRALLIAAMTPEPVLLFNHLVSDDTEAMITCLRTLGIEISEHENHLNVTGDFRDVAEKEYTLDARISGTTLRFLLPFCCLIPGTQILTGAEGLNKRPIAPLVEALTKLGAHITYLDKEGFPPVKITSSSLKSYRVAMSGDISSQFFSALLMAAPLRSGLTIDVIGEQISKPYIDMTISSMAAFGVSVTNNNYASYSVSSGQEYSGSSYSIEGDYSSAGYFFAIAALTNSALTLHNLHPDSAQADKKLLEVLAGMGNDVVWKEKIITVKGHGIKAKSINVISFPDQAQTLAVLAAFAKGKTILEGIQSLRVKETNRVTAVRNELAKMGIHSEETPHTLTIYGGNPKPAVIDTYEDHRMAMSFAVAGTTLAGMKINNPDVVGKTFPDFWQKLEKIGVALTYE